MVAIRSSRTRSMDPAWNASTAASRSASRTSRTSVPTGHQARTLGEFRDALAQVDVSALFYHTIEARYRAGRGRGDFAEWVGGALGRPDLADRLAHIDPHAGSLERIRDRHLSVLSDAISGEMS